MPECDKCRWDYPVHLLNPIVSSEGYSVPVCGICALQIINEAHGIRRTRFGGEQAEATRQGALAWRRNHPDKEPK
jgi:hypothetical protein